MEYHQGKVIWADLVTPDLADAEHFYGGLFGWTFQTVLHGDSDYAVAFLDGRPIAGILQKPIPQNEKRQPAWLTFLAVRDLKSASEIALKQGAKSLATSRTYAGRGSQSIFADPEGAVFAMLASSSGDTPDYLASPGDWIWSSLIARDPKQSADFYKAVFGYDVFDLVPSDDGAEHVILSTDDYARAGIHSLQPGHRHSHWLNFIRVVDAVASSAKAVTLGGRVLIPPRLDRQGGQVAVIADPTGAPLGLMEWTAADSKVEPK